MDLIFDAQVLAHRSADELPGPVLSSVADYYRRATTMSRPMSYLIVLVMVVLLASLGFAWSDQAGPLLAVLTVLAGVPIALALIRTVPNAVRLGSRAGTTAQRSRLARSICRDHLICLGAMSAFLLLWLTVWR